MALPSNARLLITGATGHTGSKLVGRLLDEGYRARALSRSDEKIRRVFGEGFGGETAVGDLERPETLGAALEGCDALVSISHIRFAPVLIDACLRHGVRRALFMSSSRKYTRFPDASAQRVRDGEAAVAESGLDFTIIRPTMIFGDERDANLTRLVRMIRRWPVLPLPGGGRNLVQYTFVHDLVDVIVQALKSDAAIGKDYDIGGPEPLTWRAMVRCVAEAMGRKALIVPVPLTPVLPCVWLYERIARRPYVTCAQIRRLGEDKTVDIAPAQRDLGYAPIAFKEAIARKIAGDV